MLCGVKAVTKLLRGISRRGYKSCEPEPISVIEGMARVIHSEETADHPGWMLSPCDLLRHTGVVRLVMNMGHRCGVGTSGDMTKPLSAGFVLS